MEEWGPEMTPFYLDLPLRSPVVDMKRVVCSSGQCQVGFWVPEGEPEPCYCSYACLFSVGMQAQPEPKSETSTALVRVKSEPQPEAEFKPEVRNG